MRYIFLTIVAAIFSTSAFSQFLQATLKPGSTSKSVMIVLKPTANIAGSFSSFNLVLQVPSTVTPAPTATIKSFPASTYFTQAAMLTEVGTAGGFTNYLFINSTATFVPFNFTGGTEINFMEVEFADGPANVANLVRLASLENSVGGGASDGQYQYYLEVGGAAANPPTDYFYGPTAVNSPANIGDTRGGYSFVTANSTLPVKWLGFSATRQGGDVALNWDVTNEENVTGYTLEVSTNGTNFTSLATKAKTSGSGNKKYDYLDKNVARLNSKALYYRVKQYDLDGAFNYSPIKSVRLDIKGQVALYPNPAREGFTLSVPYLQADQKRIQLQLVNNAGQVLETKTITRQQAANYYFSLQPTIASGDYLLKIFEDGTLAETKQLLIKR